MAHLGGQGLGQDKATVSYREGDQGNFSAPMRAQPHSEGELGLTLSGVRNY